jgi:hypothetical protein
MSEERKVRKRGPKWWWVAGLLAAAAAVGSWVVTGRGRPVVRWVEVLEAARQRETIYGRCWLYPRDGSEWQYALWARREKEGGWATKGLLVPTGAAGGGEPTPELTVLCEAMDYFGEEGMVGRLSGRQSGRARAGRLERAGQLMWEVELDTPGGEAGGGPDGWRLLIDPKAKLVRRLEVFMTEAGTQRLRGWCDYEYDLPLPPGFEEAPG